MPWSSIGRGLDTIVTVVGMGLAEKDHESMLKNHHGGLACDIKGTTINIAICDAFRFKVRSDKKTTLLLEINGL